MNTTITIPCYNLNGNVWIFWIGFFGGVAFTTLFFIIMAQITIRKK